MEHLKLAYALEFLDFLPRSSIKFFRTDAIILSSSKKQYERAKKGLLAATRENMHRPSR